MVYEKEILMGVLYLAYMLVGWPVFFFVLLRQFRKMADVTLIGIAGIAFLAIIPVWRELVVAVLWSMNTKIDLNRTVFKQREDE